MIRPCLFSDTEYDVKALLRGGKSDEEIRAFVKEVVRVKPEKKLEMGQIRKCQRISPQHRRVIFVICAENIFRTNHKSAERGLALFAANFVNLRAVILRRT